MFQCLGLGTVDDGGCGEDWWHPECVLGLTREEFKKSVEKSKADKQDGSPKANGIMREISVTRMEEEANGHADARRPSIVTAIAAGSASNTGIDGNDIAAGTDDEDDDTPLPPGFPPEDDFEYFLCYKCLEANPWIKKYAAAPGFLPPVFFDAAVNQLQAEETPSNIKKPTNGDSKKRKAEDDEEIASAEIMAPPKRHRSEDPAISLSAIPEDPAVTTLPITPKKLDLTVCKLSSLPLLPAQASTTLFSLFMKPDFRDHLCRCPACFPLLTPHPQLLEEEDVYEPPISEDGDNAGGSVGTGSLLDRGEAAFSNMDRVRAIQGAMAYAHLKDGLKAFLKPYAESGQAVGAEDIKSYFEKLRGDEAGIQAAAGEAKKSKEDTDEEGGTGGDSRREQSGY